MDDIYHFRVPYICYVFLEGNTHNQYPGVSRILAGSYYLFNGLFSYISSHAVVCETTRIDHMRMVTQRFCLIGEIIRVNPDTMAAYKAGIEPQEIPFGPGSFKHFESIYSETVEYY